MPREIPRVPVPDRATFYREWAQPNRPAVFTGCIDAWPAYQRWSFDWFREVHGDVPVHVNTGTYDVAMTTKHVTLGQYIDSLESTDPAQTGYLSNVNLLALIPSLAADIKFPDYNWIRRFPFSMIKFWMARAGTTTQLHRDFQHNVMGQIQGTKRFVLYSPEASSRLFPVNRGYSSEFSRGDFKDAEPEVKSAAAQVEPDFDVMLGPGELLFLPFGWWHRVHTLETTIGINLWWWTPKMAMTQGPQMVKELGPRVVRKKLGLGGKQTARAQF